MTHHLAQFNVARMRTPLEDPVMKGFVDRLDEVNALAERAEGFVWRLQTDDGDATALRPYDDDFILINMSVWEDVESFRRFVYGGAHLEVFSQRNDWFERMDGATLVMWWIPAGEIPTVEDGKRRLERLREEGPSDEAFSFRHPFPAPATDPALR